MQRYSNVVQEANGRAVENATITVYTSGVASPLPNLFQAAGSKTAPATLGNPFTTDVFGNYSFAAPDGTYDIVISGGGIPTKTLPNINFFDGGISGPSPALGTVTNVGMTVPASILAVAGSPVTGSGTLAVTLVTQVANRVLAGPASGADAVPTVRALVAADLPTAGTAGAKGSATQVPVFTTDVYGRVVSSTNTLVTPAFASLTGTPTTLAGYGIADGASIGVANAWTKAQNVTAVTLSGTTVTPDASASNVFELTLTGNTTLNNPTNLVSGSTLTIIMKQGGAGGYTISYGAAYKFPGGTVQQPDATVSSVSALYMQYSIANTILLCNYGKRYA